MKEKLSFGNIFTKGAVVYNPVLIQFAGLSTVIVASSRLKDAALMASVLFAELIVTCVLASALFRKIPRYIRVALYLVIGLGISCPLLWLLETKTAYDISVSMKIYISLLAVNSVTALHCEQFSVKNKVKIAFYDAAAAGIGSGMVLILCGALREIIGYGSVWGIDLGFSYSVSGMTMPFGCLITLGFLAVILKLFTLKIEEDEPEIVTEPISEESDLRELDYVPTDIPVSQPQKVIPQNENTGADVLRISIPAEEKPEPAETKAEEEPHQTQEVELDLGLEDDDYLNILSSVDELMEKLSSDNNGGDK